MSIPPEVIALPLITSPSLNKNIKNNLLDSILHFKELIEVKKKCLCTAIKYHMRINRLITLISLTDCIKKYEIRYIESSAKG